jgi:two-component system, NtrC family, sensor histidine kinase HydH
VRNSVTVAAGCALAVATVLVVADRVLTGDSESLLAELAEDRLHALEQVALEVETDLEQVEDDLALSRALLGSSPANVDREREIQAIVRNSREHRLARVYDRSGELAFEIVSDRPPLPSDHLHSIREEMDRTTLLVLSSDHRDSETSEPLQLGEQDRMRIIAIGWPDGVVALCVDTGAILRPLRALAADRSSKLFLLRADGVLEFFADGAALPQGTLDPLLPSLGASSGVVPVSPDVARSIGLVPSEAVAAFVRFGSRSAQYVAVTITSSSIIKEQQRVIVSRVAAASGAILLMIVLLGGWAFISGRREVALREALRHAEHIAHEHERAEKILESVPTLVVGLSSETRATSVNAAFEKRIGPWSPGDTLEQIFPDAKKRSLDHVLALIAEGQRSGKPRTEFAPNLTLFGEDGQFSLHVAPLDHPFRDTSVLLVIEDLTRLGALESQLLRAEKLATVGVLSAGVAHEIGTPLGIARGRAEYVLSKLPLEAKQREHLQLVLDQIDRVTRIMRQLLDFTRAKPVVGADVHLRTAVEDVSELLRFELDRRKLELDIELDPALPLLRAEADQLQQVVLNLLLNACQASADGGRVSIRARREVNEGLQRFVVEDRGIGIPTHLASRVFDPFFTTKKRGHGTGLGLTIVQQIVTSHGGKVQIESQEGSGTRVLVDWPISTSSTDGLIIQPRI